MPRIFLSHSSRDNRQAIALRRWLIEQNPPLADEIFLDFDPDTGIPGGVPWKDALRQASTRCEAVICLLSPNWEASQECEAEYRVAEYLNKRIFSVLIAPMTGADPTREWQQINICPGERNTTVAIGDGGEPVLFLSEGLHRLRQAIIGAGIGADTFAWPPRDDPQRAPYRGWEPLEEVDTAVFFGRNAEIMRGLDALRGMRRSGVETLFAVLGPSGTGKSSFLRAGLLPRLRRADREFLVLDIVRPQRSVLSGETGLARAIHSARRQLEMPEVSLGEIKNACRSADVESLRCWLKEIRRAASARLLVEAGEPPLPTLVLPLDQAEELFGADAGDEAPRFLDLIADVATEDTGLIVACTIRTDRYVSLQTAPQLTGVQKTLFDELKPMPRTQFKEVITGPAERAAEGGNELVLEDELVNRLLDDCVEGADTLPLLALTLSRLYQDYGPTLTLANYEAMGGMRSVVHSEIDKLLSADPERRAAELGSLRSTFIPWLATVDQDTDQPLRRLARWSDLPEAGRPLLDKLVNARLLVRGERDGEVTVEVALESLLRQWDDLAAWLAEEREDLKAADALERAARSWQRNNRDESWLLSGTRLGEAEVLAADVAFADRLLPAAQFIDASRSREDARLEAEKQQREAEVRAARQLAAAETAAREQAQEHAEVLREKARTLRALLVAALVAALAAFVGGGFALYARGQANDRARDALALKLSSEGQALIAGIGNGGDALAVQEILVAPKISGAVDQGAELMALSALRDTEKIIGQPTLIADVAFSPAEPVIASAGDDGTVRLFDADTGEQKAAVQGHTGRVNAVAFSRDGKLLASAGDDKTVRLWVATTLQPVGEPLAGHGDKVRSVAFGRDGTWLVSGSQDKSVRIWEVPSGRPLAELAPVHGESVNRVAVSPDGKLIASASHDKTVQLWNATTKLPVGTLRGHNAAVEAVAFSPDSRRIVTAGDDKTVRVWDVAEQREVLPPLRAHAELVRSAEFSPDSRRIISASRDKTVRVWNADTGEQIGEPLRGHTEGVYSAAFDPDGARIVSSSDDKTIRIWNGNPGHPLGAKLAGHSGREVPAVAFRPGGREFASGGDDGVVRIWDADSGEQIRELRGHDGSVLAVAYSEDGTRIVTGGEDTTVRIWDVDSGQQLGEPLRGHTKRVYAVAFSSDGSRIASGGDDSDVLVWDINEHKKIRALRGHESVVRGVAFSGDGKHLVSGGDDKTVRWWNLEENEPNGQPLAGAADIIRAVAVSPDGQRVAAGGFDKRVWFWDVNTGQPVGTALQTTDRVYAIAFDGDGSHLVTGSPRGLQFWDVESAKPMGPELRYDTEVTTAAVGSDGQHVVVGTNKPGDGPAGVGTLWFTPGPAAWAGLLCGKLTANMSDAQWNGLVRERIDRDYVPACDGLPKAP